jgi:hypothetical protein
LPNELYDYYEGEIVYLLFDCSIKKRKDFKLYDFLFCFCVFLFLKEQTKKIDEEEKKREERRDDEAQEINERKQNLMNSLTIPFMVAIHLYFLIKELLSPTKQDKHSSDSKVALAGSSLGVGEIEKNPVFDSIARYLSIDLSAEGRAARNRRGIAAIVHGPPKAGKSRAAIALAKYYECALLSIDSIVIDAIANSSTSAACKVRQICSDIANKHAEDTKTYEGSEQTKLNPSNSQTNNVTTGGLSVEALAQHSLSRNRRLSSS